MSTPPDKQDQLQQQIASLTFEKSLTSDAFFQLQDANKELQKSKDLFQKSETYLKATLDSTADGILVIDKNGKVIRANKQFVKFWKIPETLVKQGNDKKLLAYVLVQLTDPDAFIKKVNELYKSDKIDSETIYFKDGRIFDRYSTPLIINNKIEGRLWSFRDVTARTRAESELKKFSQAVDGAYDSILFTDVKGNTIYINDSFVRIFGYSKQEGLKVKISDLSEKPADAKIVFEGILKQGFWKGEITSVRKNGKTFPSILNCSIIKDSRDNIIGTMRVVRDITHEREIDKMKTEFVSLASHQLRTPLTSIKWNLEMIMDGSFGQLNTEQKERLNSTFKSNEEMINLVNSFLNIGRIETGRLKIKPELTDLAAIFRNTLAKLNDQIDQSKLKIIDKIANDLPKLKIDPLLISNVYLNLISNSIKYSPSGSFCEIKIVNDGNFLISSIKDTGNGIPQNEQKHIFERFFKGSNVTRSIEGSTGLGLYLAKEIVEVSGGKIWFESTENKGSTFYFSLPLKGSSTCEGDVTLSQ